MQNKEIREKQALKCMLLYGVRSPVQNKDIHEKQQKNSYKTRPYILPSGKIINKQGYEPQFLDYIFQNNILKEDEINYSVSAIKYIDGANKERKYFADFYIPKWNLIVEIKSSFTNKLDKNVLLKEQACLSQGFKYVKIINNKFEEFNCLIKQLTEKSFNFVPKT